MSTTSNAVIPMNTEFMTNALYTNLTQMGVAGRTGVANMISGGQLGVGARYTDLDAASPLVFNPTVFVVTHVPTMWAAYPKLQEMLKSLVETHASSITGVDFGYQIQTEEYAVGHDGQTQKVPTRSTRTQISPSMTFKEVSGNLVWNIFRSWIWDMQHPDTNASRLSAMLKHGSASGNGEIPPWLMSSYSMSMVGIQFDPTGLPERIIDGAFYTNMFPTDTGELGFQRVINTTEIKDRTIPFTGMVQHNENTRELAYQIATMLNLHKVNYDFALPGNDGTVKPQSGAISAAISKLGLYDEALGQELPAVTAFKPLGTDQYTDRMTTASPFAADDVSSSYPAGDPAGFTDRQPNPALNPTT